jgi:hypothetical protein
MLEISTQSLQYVKVPITATKGGVAFDPSGDVVQMAFSASEHLGANPTWCTASWEDTTGGHLARCLVGTGGAATLAAGTHWVFVKVTDSPESPVISAGPIIVY